MAASVGQAIRLPGGSNMPAWGSAYEGFSPIPGKRRVKRMRAALMQTLSPIA